MGRYTRARGTAERGPRTTVACSREATVSSNRSGTLVTQILALLVTERNTGDGPSAWVSRSSEVAQNSSFSGMVQSEVTSSIVAGVCDPGGPRTAGLTEASHNARPVAARAEKPGCYPKTAAFEPCLLRSQGDYAGSLAMYRRGHELGSKQPG
jgi:hypothetical protein